METNPTPQRTRRADRYKQQSGVVPSAELMARAEEPAQAAPIVKAAPIAQAAPRPASVAQTAATPVHQQPAPVRQRRAEQPAHASVEADEPTARTPGWLTASLIVLLILLAALFAAEGLMRAYLTTQANDRAAAHQAQLDKHPLGYTAHIDRYAAEYGLQPAYVASIILNESSYRTRAESGVGARGLMQLMPDTAEWIAHKLNIADYSFDMLWDAETNIRFGCWYLRYLADLFGGDPVAVTAAYHAGQGTVSNWLADRAYSPDGRTLPLERMVDGPTKIYAGRVTQAYGIYDALYFNTFNPVAADGGDPSAAAAP